MKKVLLFLMIALTAAACQKQTDSTPYYEAVVTVKTAADNSCYFQLDDETALKPTNSVLAKNPYGKEIRAYTLYYDKGTINTEEGGYQWKSVEVISLDTILTKKPVDAGTAVGKAGIEIYKSGVNTIEDGYLTLFFEILLGTSDKTHYVNLEKTEDPLVFNLKHNDNGDSGILRNSGLIAFDLHSLTPPDSEEYDVVIEYQGYTTDKELVFHCKDGKYTLKNTTSESVL